MKHLKNPLLLLFMVCMSTTLFSQLHQQWEESIENHSINQSINSWIIEEDNVICNLAWTENEDNNVHNYHMLIVLDSTGRKVWQFNWLDHFSSQYRIKIFGNDKTTFFFTADHQMRDSIDYVGSVNLFEGIEWMNQQEGEISLATILSDGIVFQSKMSKINTLKMLDAEGNTIWFSEDVEERSSNQNLVSNQEDRLLWLVDKSLYLLDNEGVIIGRDTSQFWSPYYSHFNLYGSFVDVCSWPSLVFKLTRSENELQFGLSKETPYTHNSFGTTYVEMEADSDGNMYVSLVDDDGFQNITPYLLKYNNGLNLLWSHRLGNQIIELYKTSNNLIYITPTSIVQLNTETGEILWEEVLPDGSYFGSSQFDLENKALYVSKKDSSSFQIIKYAVKSILSNAEISSNEWNCYPNPFSNQLNVKEGQGLIFEIIDSQGHVLFEGQHIEKTVNVRFLSPGIYYIRTTNILSGRSSVEVFVKM